MGNKIGRKNTVEADYVVEEENVDETEEESDEENVHEPEENNVESNSESEEENVDETEDESEDENDNENDDTLLQSLIEKIEDRDKKGTLKKIKRIIKNERLEEINRRVQCHYKGETLLHIAIKNVESQRLGVIKKLKEHTTLLIKQRKNTEFEGQTALHVAIVLGNVRVVKMLLKEKAKKQLRIPAIGSQFKNTAMMGELPLSVAALVMRENNSNSKKVINVMLKKGAEFSAKNSHGDTVFHSLIKYGEIYPEKIRHVVCAFKHLRDKYEKLKKPDTEEILFCKNNEELTPLQLSAKLGVGKIFASIIEVPQVYRFQNTQDGLFDIRVYDVTEFDRLIVYIDVQDKPKCTPTEITILERLFDTHCTHKEAFQILNLKLVQFILQTKWNSYRVPLFIWLLLHLMFISISTLTTVQKSSVLVCSVENQNNCNLHENFYAIGIMYLSVGLIYFIFSSLILQKLIVRCHLGGYGLIWHNLDYIICLTIMSLGALVESLLTFFQLHWDYHLVCLLLCGWYFMLYFSPFHQNLVAFTYMLKAGLVKDFIPFSLVFIFLLLSFTTVMHMLFHGTENDPEEFETFRDSLFTMFKLGVALDDIGVLSQSRIPWLAYTMFVLFAILSFIHILNALIAIMSQTFSDVHQKRYSYLKYQRLCMIELFEDIIITPYLEKFMPCINKAKHWTRKRRRDEKLRFLTTVHSLDDSYYSRYEEDTKNETSNDNLQKIIDCIQTSRNLPEMQTKDGEKEIAYIQTVEKTDKCSQVPDDNSS